MKVYELAWVLSCTVAASGNVVGNTCESKLRPEEQVKLGSLGGQVILAEKWLALVNGDPGYHDLIVVAEAFKNGGETMRAVDHYHRAFQVAAENGCVENLDYFGVRLSEALLDLGRVEEAARELLAVEGAACQKFREMRDAYSGERGVVAYFDVYEISKSLRARIESQGRGYLIPLDGRCE